MGAFFGNLSGEAGFREEGVIERLNHEGGNSDVGEMGVGAGVGPVVAGVGEAVERGGEAVIEFGEGFDFFDIAEVELAGEFLVLLDDLLFEAVHEAGHVDFVLPLAKLQGAGGEIAGCGEGDGGFDLGVDVGALLAKVFENDVSAEAEANEGDALVALCDGMIDHVAEVIAHPGVVGAEEAVGFAGAATAIPSEGVPVSFLEGEGHATNVFGG